MANLIKQTQIKPGQIIEMIFRYRWLIICLLSASLTIGLVKTLVTDRVYKAKTLILIQPQVVPANYVRPALTIGIAERLSTISQQILSRTNLSNIINKFGLYKNAENVYLEDKIDFLREQISITLDGEIRRNSPVTFSIAVRGTKPDMIMQITNTLASFFMDENLKSREAQVEGTSQFIEEELIKIKKKLELQEINIMKYRSIHVGGLPNDLLSNLSSLEGSQSALNVGQISLREAMNRESLLRQRIIRQRQIPAQELGNGNRFISDEDELNRLKGELSNLRLKYTEKHPDVVKLENSIEKFEEKIRNNDETQGEKLLSITQEVLELEMQLKEVQNSIPGMTSDVQANRERVEFFQRMVNKTPQRERDLQLLQRDHSITSIKYASLLDRKLEAELSMNMERRQKGDKFKVIDYAIRPEKPISPDVMNAFLISLGVGCALPGGLIYLFFVFDNTVRRKEDIIDAFGLPILVGIGSIKMLGDKYKKKKEALTLVAVSSYIIAIMGIFMVLESKGIERSVNLLKSFINF